MRPVIREACFGPVAEINRHRGSWAQPTSRLWALVSFRVLMKLLCIHYSKLKGNGCLPRCQRKGIHSLQRCCVSVVLTAADERLGGRERDSDGLEKPDPEGSYPSAHSRACPSFGTHCYPYRPLYFSDGMVFMELKVPLFHKIVSSSGKDHDFNSFSKCMWSSYYVRGTVPGVGRVPKFKALTWIPITFSYWFWLIRPACQN